MTRFDAIDVIIPTVGRPSLAAAIQSARQDGVERIIVILDEPSVYAEVRRIAGALGAELIVTAGRVGGGAARQLGLERASASLVAFLDDDDEWRPGRAASVLRVAKACTPDCDPIILSRIQFRRPSGAEVIAPARLPGSQDGERFADYVVRRDRLRFGRNLVQTSALVIDRRLALRVGWDRSFKKHQDWDFALRAVADPAARLLTITQPTVTVHQGTPGSISKTMDWRASLDWYERHSSKLGYRAASDFLCVHVLRAALSTRDRRGVLAFLRSRRLFPHVAAAAVGLSGVRPT